MHLSKKSRRKIELALDEARRILWDLSEDWFLPDAKYHQLEEVSTILMKAQLRLEETHGKRRSKRGVQKAWREAKTSFGRGTS